MSSLKSTIENIEWVKKHEQEIKDIFPNTFTHVNNINGLNVMFEFKILGIDYKSKKEFIKILVFLTKIGLILRDGHSIKSNPHKVFV